MSILPTGIKRPKRTTDGASMVIFGPPGIGKTTFAAAADRPLFLETEPGTAFLDAEIAPPVPIGSWQDFKLVLGALEGGEPHEFRTIVVDTIDRLYKLCFAHICAARGVEHPSDRKDFGAGWTAINVEWTSAIGRLRNLKDKTGRPVLAVFISHERRSEITEKRGSGVHNTGRFLVTSDLSGTARDTLHGACDFIFHAYLDGDVRMIRTQPIDSGAEKVEAKCRVKRLPDTLPLDWTTMIEAFNAAWAVKPPPTPKKKSTPPPTPGAKA